MDMNQILYPMQRKWLYVRTNKKTSPLSTGWGLYREESTTVEQVVIGKEYRTVSGHVVQVVGGDVLNGEVSSLEDVSAPKIMFLECIVLAGTGVGVGVGGTMYLLNTQIEEID